MKEKHFGENLKISRKKSGMTQKQLGDLSGVGQVAIANYEKGIRFPGEETLRQLAEILHVSLDFLLAITTCVDDSVSIISRNTEVGDHPEQSPDDQKRGIL